MRQVWFEETMQRYLIIFSRFLLLLLFACNCSSPKSTLLQPDKQPYNFKNVLNLAGDHIILADLDGNGFTEIITIDTSLAPGKSASFILLLTFEGKVIEQINYPGRIIDSIFPLDYNDDGILEILVPFVQNDSLFVSFVNDRGKKLFYFFLIDGRPRIEDGGTMNWDPQIRGCYIHDLDKDGVRELITVITTGYARLPRGILVHSLPHGELIGKSIIGSPPRDNFLDDFDGDGQVEILCFGTAPNNGANAGGFDDQYSYLIVFDLSPAPGVNRHQKISSKFSNYWLCYEDFDGDAKKELLAWTECTSERIIRPKIVELDPFTFKEIKKWSLNTPISTVITTNLNRDTRREIVAIRSKNEIMVLNHNFDEQIHRVFPLALNTIKTLPDVDKDGIDEIVACCYEGDFLLNPELKIKAVFPGMRCLGIIHRGDTLPPQIVMRVDNHYVLVQLVKNRFYLVNRYYLIVLYVLAGGIFFVLGKFITNLSWQNRLFHHIQSLAIDSDIRGFLLFDAKQKIYIMNRTLRQWMGIPELEKNRKRRLTNLFSRFPEILTFLNDTMFSPPRRYEKILMLNLNNHKRNVQLIMDPMPVIMGMKRFWLVTVIDKSYDDETLQAKTWCKMAQKTAHDIKNPLSAMLLTLQRMPKLYREPSPQTVEELDRYVARIIERIESLRRISKNLMKFVNVENLNLVNTDINEFLNETTNIIQLGLPPDIQLHKKLSVNLPIVKIDHDAMRSVMENIVSNSVNAMPDGGEITISTQFLQGLSFPGNGQTVKDYVLIEVLDTGIGISAADREHLFEPDFTKTECGNGFGLAYVKKTVDDHGGYIEVESEPGSGTAFCIYIPTI